MPMLGRRSKGSGDKSAEAAADKPRAKRPASSGRVTPKGSGRYTPPVPQTYKVSPRWVPVLMLALLIVGMLIIVSNYLPGAGFLPGDTNNVWLLVGLGLITGGFITATKYR